MKCPKCRRNMTRKKMPAKKIYYFECPRCGTTVGKPKKEETSE